MEVKVKLYYVCFHKTAGTFLGSQLLVKIPYLTNSTVLLAPCSFLPNRQSVIDFGVELLQYHERVYGVRILQVH